MPSYFSEIDYYGQDPDEFIEVAVPAGTDVSGYSVQLYDASGALIYTFSLGTVQTTIGGHDVYVIDASNPIFDSSGDPTGVMYPDDGLALVDGGGTVLQFVSWEGNTVTATGGAANGMTSTNIGSAMVPDQSLQSDDRGATYYTQTSTNKGTIPACYARGTVIDTPDGARRIEDLRIGDHISRASGGSVPIRWLWTHNQTFTRDDPAPPIRLKRGCLGADLPTRDLVVSAQHRIALGCFGQMSETDAVCAPAIGLTGLSGVHAMAGRTHVQWWHIVCDRHELIRANGMVTETMLLGPQMYRAFSREERRALRTALGGHFAFGAMPAALPCLSVGQTRAVVCGAKVCM